MNRTHRAPRVVIYQRGPVWPGMGVQRCGGECCSKCLLIFFTVMFLLVGFIVTMVGYFAKPFYGPEDDWCDFCREDRLTAERNFKNCRVVGPILLAIGGALLFASICFIRVQRKKNQGQVIREAPTGEISTTRPGGTDTSTASTTHYPANTYGYQQPYGQSPAYPPGPYPNNPPPPPPGSYSPYPMGQVHPPPQQPYPPQQGPGMQPYPPHDGQGVQPYQTDIPPPPSYDTVVNQSMPAAPSAPPLEKVG